MIIKKKSPYPVYFSDEMFAVMYKKMIYEFYIYHPEKSKSQ